MSRLLLFAIICISVFTYFGLRLTYAFGTAAWVGSFLSLALLFTFPVMFRLKHSDALGVRLLRWTIYFDMGFLSLFASLLVARDIFLLPFTWWKPELYDAFFGVTSSSVLIALALLGLLVGSITALTGPWVREVKVEIENLPKGLEGLTIAQISDLHVGPTIGLSYVETVVRKTLEIGADLVVFTGDIADGDFEQFAPTLAPLKQLAEKSMVYYVPGNHEYYWDGPRWIRHFAALGMKTLLNSHEIQERGGERIVVAGVLDPAVHMIDPVAKPDAVAALGAAQGALKILLSHHPGIARKACGLGYQLQLSGHTHAGQFFPWTLVVPRVHEFSKGLERCDSMWVYVNPGTGSWGPPLRLGTTPEITCLRLVRKA